MPAANSVVEPVEPDPVILRLPDPVTEAMLIAFGRSNPEYRFESTSDGRLVVSLLTGTFASGGEAELLAQIVSWNRECGLGRVTSSSGGITLSDGAIKGPDATFISHERLAALSPKRRKRAFEAIAPDAVFELYSPTDRLRYTQDKCNEYVATGSRIAVLLNPRDRSVTMYRDGQTPLVVRDALLVTIGSEMPGFELDAGAIFNACEPQVDTTR
jgi:Uma2 family endonuclease